MTPLPTPTEEQQEERGRAEMNEAALVCYEAYAALGAFLMDLAENGHPQAEKLLDNLSAARLVHDDVLPFADPAGAAPTAEPDRCPSCGIGYGYHLAGCASNNLDSIALEAAQEIALMWGRDRTQFVAKIQVAVRAAMERAAGVAIPTAPAVFDELVAFADRAEVKPTFADAVRVALEHKCRTAGEKEVPRG
jgi:hypothetical protein